MKNLVLIIITFFTLNAVAQEKSKVVKKNQTEMLAENETNRLTKQLDLSPDQQKKVHVVMLNHFSEKLEMKKEMKQSVSSKKAINKKELGEVMVKQKQVHSEKLNNQLKEILSEEQYKNYSEMNLKQKKAKHKALKKKY
ncbi:DUF4890 domain-containing protein [Winogradskyella luteola]|uniref:LTXXQ motif family protein n=1 Tax=Winogradskyella luteola TaxID=2828330 RepID=A0A9X1F8K2_9FLAO|nr:DUF4890 domain-containing protein [Winogradskyella luteola]MBV7269337.1 hypothetical protein [Winogradskyella luteola]